MILDLRSGTRWDQVGLKCCVLRADVTRDHEYNAPQDVLYAICNAERVSYDELDESVQICIRESFVHVSQCCDLSCARSLYQMLRIYLELEFRSVCTVLSHSR